MIHQFAVLQQRDFAAKLLDFRQIVRGINHRYPLPCQIRHAVKDKAARLRVDADRDFIKEYQLRRVNQADGKIQTTFKSARKMLRRFVLVGGQVGLFQQRVQTTFVAHFVKRGEKQQVVPHRKLRIKREILRHQTDFLPLAAAQQAQRLAVKQNFTLPYFLQACQKRHQRRFSRTVMAEQPQTFAVGNIERHIVQRGGFGFGITVGEGLDLNHGFRRP